MQTHRQREKGAGTREALDRERLMKAEVAAVTSRLCNEGRGAG